MTDRRPLDPVALQRALEARVTRRNFMRGAGVGVAGISLASILASCGQSSWRAPAQPKDLWETTTRDIVHFANWPLYMDEGEDEDGNLIYPTLDAFTTSTGMAVDYQDLISANAEFFGKLRPQLQSGDPTGWDIIVITNGREMSAMIENRWVYELDPALRPNFEANAVDFAVNPGYDPGNKHSMAWQSGIDGIGVNLDRVSQPVTSIQDLADPKKVGYDSVGMLKADMADFVMINLGIDPETSGPDEWKEAASWLQFQKESGTVRNYYSQGYLDDFKAGNLAASMAWSGDIEYYRVWEDRNWEFVFPDGGALIWIDNMMIPRGSLNPVGAAQLMDWYYDPEIATGLTEFVLYMSPVNGVQDLMYQHAEAYREDGDEDSAVRTEESASSEFLFPTPEFLSRTRFSRNMTTDEEVREWDAIFDPISQG